MPEMMRLTLILLVVCLVSAGALSQTYESTKAMIAKNRAATEADARLAVIPGATKVVAAPEMKMDKVQVFRGTDDNGKTIGFAFKVSEKGFSGVIDVMIGAKLEGSELKVAGTQVLRHSETPGLGAEMTTRAYNVKLGAEEPIPAFQKQFVGLRTSELFLSKSGKGKIDSITAATISSRAFTIAVRKGIEQLASKVSGVSK